MEEEWLVIRDFPKYFVSNHGRIRNNTTMHVLKPWKNNKGYNMVSLFNDDGISKMLVHRMVAGAFCPNPDNHSYVDHANGIVDDNRTENLRWCNRSQNQSNMKLSKRNSSGYKGVSFDKRRNKWAASIYYAGRNHHLGRFCTKEEASTVYNDASKSVRGDFHRAL